MALQLYVFRMGMFFLYTGYTQLDEVRDGQRYVALSKYLCSKYIRDFTVII